VGQFPTQPKLSGHRKIKGLYLVHIYLLSLWTDKTNDGYVCFVAIFKEEYQSTRKIRVLSSAPAVTTEFPPLCPYVESFGLRSGLSRMLYCINHRDHQMVLCSYSNMIGLRIKYKSQHFQSVIDLVSCVAMEHTFIKRHNSNFFLEAWFFILMG
jgi:hypothetical protein